MMTIVIIIFIQFAPPLHGSNIADTTLKPYPINQSINQSINLLTEKEKNEVITQFSSNLNSVLCGLLFLFLWFKAIFIIK